VPLVTNDIANARSAFAALEARTAAAEFHVATLQANVVALESRLATLDDTALLRQRIADLEAEVISLQTQLDQVRAVTVDLGLEHLIGGLGLAAAIGEATMPGRSVGAVEAAIKSFVSPVGGAVGLKFQQPELSGISGGLSSTTVRIANVPPQAGVAAPLNLFTVLTEKQAVYDSPVVGALRPAADIVADVARVLAEVGGWTFTSLVQGGAAIAQSELALAELVAGRASPDAVAAFATAAGNLSALTARLADPRAASAGNLAALTVALDSTTVAARRLEP
jgi:hypothetical protein